MFGENNNLKNLKDINLSSPNLPFVEMEEQGWSVSYKKIDKLITALYMVTDIMEKDEPLRNNLRTIGTEIISDIHLIQYGNTGHDLSLIKGKIADIVSFLDIASAVKIISKMNCSILRKEFLELNESIKESSEKIENPNAQINLTEFFENSSQFNSSQSNPILIKEKGDLIHKGHARIGVQKGSTLMDALSDRNFTSSLPRNFMSNKNNHLLKKDVVVQNSNTIKFDLLKKQRREEITKILQKNGGSSTITDIKNEAYGSLISCGEKTLQRELVSMVKDSVLDKTGEKRWSRYFLKK